MQPPTLLKNKNFVKLWISEAASVIALSVLNYLLLLKLFAVTGSTLAISFLWIAYALPTLLVGPFAATVVDLVDKKILLIFTNIFQALTILLLLTLKTRFFYAYGIVFLYSLLNQFYLPAESASLPGLVKKADLPQSNGFFLLTKQASNLVGFGIAGFLNKFLGFHPSLIFCSSLLAIAFVSVLFLPSLKAKKTVNLETNLANFFMQVAAGYKLIKNHNSILFPLGLLAGAEIIYTIIAINIPALAEEVFLIPLDDAVLFIVLPAILGALTGIYLIPRLFKQKTIRKKAIITYSLMLLSANLIFTVTLLSVIPLYLRPFFIILIAYIFGASFIGIEMPAQTYLQQTAPNQMLGRVFGNLWFIITLSTIAPLILSASITEVVGARFLLTFIAIGVTLAWIYIRKFSNAIILKPPTTT